MGHKTPPSPNGRFVIGLTVYHRSRPMDSLMSKWLVGIWIGLRENLQESPIFNGKIDGFL